MGLIGDRTLAIATWVAILGTLAVNTLSNFFPIDGNTVADLANGPLGGVLITPANYAFIIWGVIYVGLIAYAWYQSRRKYRSQLLIQRINYCLITACVAQMAWIYLFTLQLYWLSVVAMVIILSALIAAYSELEEGQHQVSSRRKRWVNGPISIYLAWISVATVVNVASALYASGLPELGLSGAVWTAIMIVVANLIAVLALVQRGDLPFTLVFIWANVAIAQRHHTIPTIWVPALVMSIALVGLLAYRRYPKKSW
ncbi:tryptophan-rich sensory protein [Leptolyngbyaceae cyanobacterium CCMR0082]|uniref:Tryptophan-rich sensory protein n=1 Tax=Adonisia turfae CCMR0082 TaxID=2304604 RepID=A0A6M0S2Y6_9CYAN|nr:tryptophan-rich sensory protein [Adonisia turfae]MDV3351016.1 tryptophan-rich sensory protein [Leptothoe sp. LEGE 181152]NEZ62756.1 tryptophan-rich sensory protein [Adonisia turfae CCMR0082]